MASTFSRPATSREHEAALTHALELSPREMAAFATLSRLPGGAMPEHCRFVEFLLGSGQLTVDDQIRAHYALALQYERSGDDARPVPASARDERQEEDHW